MIRRLYVFEFKKEYEAGIHHTESKSHSPETADHVQSELSSKFS